jgi:hypothetical protein
MLILESYEVDSSILWLVWLVKIDTPYVYLIWRPISIFGLKIVGSLAEVANTVG